MIEQNKLIYDEFDSVVLGKKTFRIYLNKEVNNINLVTADTKSILEMVVAFTQYNPKNIKLLNKEGFEYITSRNSYQLDISDIATLTPSLGNFTLKKLIELNENELDSLIELGLTLSVHSRFSKDLKLGDYIGKNVYRKWLENSFYNKFTDQVYSISDKKKPVALITLKKRNNLGYIDFMVVKEGYRGKQLGRKLVQLSINYFKALGVKKLFLNTEAENVAANHFYQKLGFRLIDYKLIYHWHLEE